MPFDDVYIDDLSVRYLQVDNKKGRVNTPFLLVFSRVLEINA